MHWCTTHSCKPTYFVVRIHVCTIRAYQDSTILGMCIYNYTSLKLRECLGLSFGKDYIVMAVVKHK